MSEELPAQNIGQHILLSLVPQVLVSPVLGMGPIHQKTLESAPGVDIVPGASPSSVCHVGVKKSKPFYVAFFLNV